jgi:hypothetical protein
MDFLMKILLWMFHRRNRPNRANKFSVNHRPIPLPFCAMEMGKMARMDALLFKEKSIKIHFVEII